MLRTVLCIWAAIVAGFGAAVVLGLGTAAVSAAVYKSQVPIGESVANRVQDNVPAVRAAGIIGFGAGAGTIIWLFMTNKPPKKDPGENGTEGRSEV
jgi:hypothetical protein